MKASRRGFMRTQLIIHSTIKVLVTSESNLYNETEEAEVCHEPEEYIMPILMNVKFWVEGVCIVVVASIGLIGNFLTILVIANLENTSRYFNCLVLLTIK